MPLHMRLVLVNGLVFAGGVLVTSLAPEHERGPAALLALVLGVAAIFAVNTRHLRQTLTPLMSTIGTLRSRWENEHRTQTARNLASREYDGQRMAVELHDNVSDNLSAALVALKKAIDHAPPELAAELKTVQHNARLSLVEIRKIGRRLRPETLEDLGLHSALGFLASTLAARSAGVRVKRHIEGPFHDLDDETELVIYRVAEESLNNIGHHARAQKVEISLRREQDTLVLRVTDDGVGIGSNGERGGILGMRERAALVGGRLSVVPRRGGGTEIRLDVPAHRVGRPAG